jgi:hypothetical protein
VRIISSRSLAAATAAGLALTGAGTLPGATASAAVARPPAASATAARTGWSVSDLIAAGTSGSPDLQGMAAGGRSAAWAVGSNGGDLLVIRWNGKNWQQMTVPSAFSSVTSAVNVGTVAASSPTDMWTLPTVGSTQYALHWNGTKWASYKLRRQVGGLAIVSASDVWAFGAGSADRFDGRSWRTEPSTGLFYPQVTALGAKDLWAAGDTMASINSASPVTRIVHWNGSRWRAVMTVPKLRVGRHSTIVPQVDVVNPDDIWAVEAFPVNRCGCEPPPRGLYVLHWNGDKWKTVVTDSTDYVQSLVPAGRNAIWGTLLNVKSGNDMLFRYEGGKFRRISAPRGFAIDPFDATVPGTDALWVIANTPVGKAGTSSAAILRYTP